MAYDPREALREAGVLTGPLAAEVEAAFGTLTREEVDLLISVKDKLPASLPDVLSQSWSRPEVEVHGGVSPDGDAACLCGAWSGSGSG